ncbi:Hypothetical predicted protein [Olea europaea subsp. europaea]|uniref:Uncharacterized protein n=1 Tax=Olea europaea subsp. europaea TaxID=158383 RepID=A0A8S0T2M7_OLEEU|nr:Hypothetical predicted protein [Olea europaea subsp. europaea]
MVETRRGEVEEESSKGGFEDDEESGDSEDEVDSNESGGDESGDGNDEDFDDCDSGDSDGEIAGASLTRAKVEEMLLAQRTLIGIPLHTVKLEIIQHVTNEFVRLREFISTLVPPSGSATTVPTAEAKNEPIDIGSLLHGGCGMYFEPRMNDDDDEVASSGWGNREDKPVASTSGVAEVDGK